MRDGTDRGFTALVRWMNGLTAAELDREGLLGEPLNGRLETADGAARRAGASPARRHGRSTPQSLSALRTCGPRKLALRYHRIVEALAAAGADKEPARTGLTK